METKRCDTWPESARPHMEEIATRVMRLVALCGPEWTSEELDALSNFVKINWEFSMPIPWPSKCDGKHDRPEAVKRCGCENWHKCHKCGLIARPTFLGKFDDYKIDEFCDCREE